MPHCHSACGVRDCLWRCLAANWSPRRVLHPPCNVGRTTTALGRSQNICNSALRPAVPSWAAVSRGLWTLNKHFWSEGLQVVPKAC